MLLLPNRRRRPLILSLCIFLSITNIVCNVESREEKSNELHVRTSLSQTSNDAKNEELSLNDVFTLKQQKLQSKITNETNPTAANNYNNIIIDTNTVSNSDPCLALTSCTSCYNYSSKCHWCGSDEKCHSKGSIHGCLYGKSCDSTPPPDTNDTRCNKISNCTECGYSYFRSCHWCEFDNRCHAKGSVYGCLYGVDCYSNVRCQRQTPEYVVEDSTAAPIGFLMIVLFVLSLGLCCCTTCFCVVRYSKGAYDDLTDLIRRESLKNNASTSTDQEDSSAPLLNKDVAEVDLARSKQTFQISQSNQNASHIYQTCRMFYILSIITLCLIAFSTVYYYPVEPEYNFCNDEFDWKSIIQGMTSFKMEASFQMLASVYNPNHFNVEVTSGSGTFYHDGTYVGHFEIPNNTIATAQSINDYLVTATFTPDKWQALSLTTEFFRGTLTFVVQATLDVIVPGFDFYTMHVDLKDFVVHVNEMSDRHLCSCATWGGNSSLVEIS